MAPFPGQGIQDGPCLLSPDGPSIVGWRILSGGSQKMDMHSKKMSIYKNI